MEVLLSSQFHLERTIQNLMGAKSPELDNLCCFSVNLGSMTPVRVTDCTAEFPVELIVIVVAMSEVKTRRWSGTKSSSMNR